MKGTNYEEVNKFLLGIVSHFLAEKKSFFLRILRCRLLFKIKKQVLALHEAGELNYEKLSVFEEFMVF